MKFKNKLLKLLQLKHLLQIIDYVEKYAFFQIIQNIAIYALLRKYVRQEKLLRGNP